MQCLEICYIQPEACQVFVERAPQFSTRAERQFGVHCAEIGHPGQIGPRPAARRHLVKHLQLRLDCHRDGLRFSVEAIQRWLLLFKTLQAKTDTSRHIVAAVPMAELDQLINGC